MDMSGRVQIFISRYLYLFCISILILTMIILVNTYSRKLKAFEIATISSLSAIAVVGRIAFFFIPWFTPVTAVIIISGSVYGPSIGCFIGALTALISNVVFGQGTWTPFQMLCWGIIGFFSGFIKKKWQAVVYAIAIIMLFYGPVMNMYTMLVSGNEYSWRTAALFEIHGLPVDTVHALSTVIILCIGWKPMRKKLVRMRDKYGVLTKEGMRGR